MTEDTIAPIVFLVGCAVAVAALLMAAHRFARRRQREGLWNKDGPIDPSPAPPGWNGVRAYNSPPPAIETEDVDEGEDETPPAGHR